jgi:hypothetical protein
MIVDGTEAESHPLEEHGPARAVDENGVFDARTLARIRDRNRVAFNFLSRDKPSALPFTVLTDRSGSFVTVLIGDLDSHQDVLEAAPALGVVSRGGTLHVTPERVPYSGVFNRLRRRAEAMLTIDVARPPADTNIKHHLRTEIEGAAPLPLRYLRWQG